jgi:hypothetical protein
MKKIMKNIFGNYLLKINLSELMKKLRSYLEKENLQNEKDYYF